MYGYKWTKKNGIYLLVPDAKVIKEIRPVFKEELDNFGLDAHWEYPKTDAPLLWAEGIRRYILNGEVVAEAIGGSFYSKPTINVKKDGLKLKAINIASLWKTNESLMRGLEETAVGFIRRVYDEYAALGLKFVVAFSGGKDSLVLLDLVAKALRPDEFVVIFSNTGMELNATLESVKRSMKHWGKLRFYEAASHMSPDESWDAFGPPGRRLRWCCSVHKSVPTIIKLREITGDHDARAVVFDGVRKEESAARSMYEAIGEGVKNISQVNCSPILEWGTAEIYLYLLKNKILFNDAYRIGLFRVGCKICPMSSAWWDGIANDAYPDELATLLNKVEDYANNTKTAKEQRKYIEEGGWKGRMGGRGLKDGGNRVTEVIDGDKIIFRFSRQMSKWLEVSKLLGEIVEKKGNTYTQLMDHQSYKFSIDDDTITYSPYSSMNRFIISHLRGVANKVAYCVGCKACVVQCPTGAFEISEDNTILIREELCIHCANCIEFTGTKGCLAAKSLHTTGGFGMNLKGMNRYQHFGFRRPWLEHFFEYGTDCFSMKHLGNRQYDALRVWVREAGLLSPSSKGDKSGILTPLCERLLPLGSGNPLVWSIIWTNLAYSSVIAKWYMLYAQPGETYDKAELVFMLGDDYSPSTRDNAVTALLETFRHSPIGTALKQGIPIPDGTSFKFIKQGWDTPEAISVLYALYKFAEETGRYTFTLTQLDNARGNAEAKGVDPVSIFGLNPNNFKAIVQDIALHYSEFIRVAFVQDLDNIMLVPEKKAIDVLDLIVG
ncbi:phosphoadenosine phosphosulfate reductase [Parasporobacterium paucivorans DSM 15970]|uniref:Phosphoadenosine phosphosulfate reductase n=2 Tax=Parasporobacterium TaxID=115543 RepID=A0A1M6AZT8_9FIRM|nr:phosphoadenosine phosphosulfate reductase [Parasporobacterium paucivorans DSM 15970]